MEKLRKSLVIVGGILYLLFGAFHLSFWKMFNRNNEFDQMGPLLSKILQMLNVALIVFFVSLGVIMLIYRYEILNSKLGRAILYISTVFFIVRGLAEFVFPMPVYPLMATMFFCALVFLIPALKKVS
jgi:magnesium-transporting ATPase (P-type)